MAKSNSKHTKKTGKKHGNKSFLKGAFAIVFILIIIIFVKLKLNNKNISYENTQIILNNINITKDLQNDAIVVNNKVYLSTEDIQKYLDSTLYLEEENKTIITTSNKKLAAIKIGEENILLNGSKVEIKGVSIEENEKTYLAVSELEDVYDYKFNYIKESNVGVIENLNKESVKAYAKKNLKVKQDNKTFSKIVEKVAKESWVTYIDEENGIAKIRTKNGNIGYVKKSKLDNFVVEREDFEEKEEEAFPETSLKYDITGKDISSFEKRLNIINRILQQAIKNDNMYVKIIYEGEQNFEFERFKIEIKPILRECGITVQI